MAELNIRNNQLIDDSLLSEILAKQYGYKIEFFDENSQPELMKLRSIVISKNGPKLFINKRLTTQQRAFTYGREIGYQYLKIKTRPLISSVVEATSFEQVLGNFQASYFAGAILINRKTIIKRLDDFFQYRVWNSTGFLAIMDEFCCTPEVFLSRLTNVMPSHFKINELFFFRFNNTVNNEFYYLNKELHLAKLHPPHGTDLDEHYCRRWASITALQELCQKQIGSPKIPIKPFAKAQISDFSDDGSSQYFVITMAMPSALNSLQNSSVTVGFLMDEKLRNTILFLKDPSIIIKKVGETCERCGKLDCIDRVSPSIN